MRPYSDTLLDYFHHPRNAGEIEQPTAVVEAANPVCGDTLKLWAKAQDGILVQVRFKAAGCVPALACGSWLAERLETKRVSDLSPLAPAEFEEALGGLPQASHHAAVLAAEVMHRLLEALAKAAQ
ncbi:MAG: iron-sulfur cluster assembly scaffold protein [Terriglobia bacterium]